jgi:Zn-dependent protease
MNNLAENRPVPFKGLWIRVLRIGGVGVYVDPIVLGILGVLIVATGASPALMAILVGSVLLHELGHALMARQRGLAVTGIYLHVFALAHVERGRPRDELLITLAGPMANLLLACILLLMPGAAVSFPGLRLQTWLSQPFWAAVGCNLLMGLLNLVPVLPADGGRALRTLFRMFLTAALVHTSSSIVNVLAGVALMAWSLYAETPVDSNLLFVLGLFACLFGWREARAAAASRGKRHAIEVPDRRRVGGADARRRRPGAG